MIRVFFFFFFSSRRRHTRLQGDWSSDVCSSDLSYCRCKKKKHVIKISRPLIFDNRLIPKRFEGLDVKTNIKLSADMPVEFDVDRSQPDWHKKQYIWAPERFEKYVARCEKEIKVQLNEPQITKMEILDALCFGNFEEHKQKSIQLI